ncbi:MAG: polyamine aminopropyltransferase [Thermodesulfobacteriota bacterium]
METDDALSLWVTETHQNTMRLGFKVEKTLFSGRSRFQQVDVVQTRDHGVMLLNDGLVMLSERDEFIYHEMITHVPLFVHPNPRRVLVIGGGDGGTVREVLRHPGVERAVMVEIDEMVVNACRKYMPEVSCALDDPRLELRIEDGIKFVAETEEGFDVILVDSTDPIGPAAPLFNKEFYSGVSRLLTEEGILISQAESPFYNQDIQRPMLLNQRPFFEKLHIYLFSNLTYPGGLWSFGFASQKACPLKDFDPGRPARSGIETRYYNPGVHRASFMLPTFMSRHLEGVIDPLDAAGMEA